MQNLSTKSSSSESEYRTYSIHDPPGYIKPSLQDMLLTDITAEELLIVALRLEVGYLSPASTFPMSFPVKGEIYGPNKRLMVNLACCIRGKSATAINIIFLVDTGSPASYLSAKAMEALIGRSASNLPPQLPVMIHTKKVVACHLSPHDKHFADVNVLGMDFLSVNMLSLLMDYDQQSFQMIL